MTTQQHDNRYRLRDRGTPMYHGRILGTERQVTGSTCRLTMLSPARSTWSDVDGCKREVIALSNLQDLTLSAGRLDRGRHCRVLLPAVSEHEAYSPIPRVPWSSGRPCRARVARSGRAAAPARASVRYAHSWDLVGQHSWVLYGHQAMAVRLLAQQPLPLRSMAATGKDWECSS